MADYEYVENYRGFDIILTKDPYTFLHYEVRRGSEVCGDYLLYSDALNAVDLFYRYFRGEKND